MAAEAFAYPPIIPDGAQVGSPVALAAVSADMSDHGPLMPNEREPSPSDAPYEFVAAIPSSPQLVRYEGHHHASLDPIPEMGAFEYVYSDGPAPEQFFLCFATARPFEIDVIKETVCPPAQTPIAEESDGETDLVTDESDTIALKCGQMQECPWLFKHGQIGAWMSKHRQIVVTYEYTQYDRAPYHTIIRLCRLYIRRHVAKQRPQLRISPPINIYKFEKQKIKKNRKRKNGKPNAGFLL
jgi:hypothetical protein